MAILNKRHTESMHDSALVVGQDPEKLLAPYGLNLTATRGPYDKFIDTTRELRTTWENRPEFRKKFDGDFDALAKDWDRSEYDAERGAYGYWHNPDWVWDGYVLGGRYAKMLPLKAGGCADQALKRDIALEWCDWVPDYNLVDGKLEETVAGVPDDALVSVYDLHS